MSSQAEEVAHDATDLARQHKLVQQLADQAQLVVIARAISVSKNSYSATFQVVKVLKGRAVGTLRLTWPGEITVGCYAADMFKDIFVKPGQTYLLYVLAGHILRAGSVSQRYGELPYSQELRLIHEHVGA